MLNRSIKKNNQQFNQIGPTYWRNQAIWAYIPRGGESPMLEAIATMVRL
jgi:hypothetical protein